MSNPATSNTILLLDDDQYFRQIVSRLLSASGYKTIEARNAKDATDLVNEKKPALAIVDYKLPGMDGVAWIGQMRSSGVTMPMVFLTASRMDQKVVNMLRNLLNVPTIVQKPVNPAAFLQQIQGLLPLSKKSLAEVDLDANSDVDELSPEVAMQEAPRKGVLQGTSYEGISESELLVLELELSQARREYIKATVDEISEFLTKYETIDVTKLGVRAELVGLSHKIRGTSGSFSLTEVSQLAGTIEDFLAPNENEPHDTKSDISGAIVKLVSDMRRAIVTAVWEHDTSQEAAQRKILVVADPVQHLTFSDKVSRALCAHVVVAESVERAMLLLQAYNIEAVLIDMDSQGTDDVLTFVGRLRHERRRNPVLGMCPSPQLTPELRLYMGDCLAQFSEKEIGVNERTIERLLNAVQERQFTMTEETREDIVMVRRTFLHKVGDMMRTDPARIVTAVIFQIKGFDDLMWKNGLGCQVQITFQALKLLRARFRVHDMRGKWSESTLMVAFSGLTADFVRPAAELFVEEFTGLQFTSRDGSTFAADMLFALVDTSTTKESIDLLLDEASKQLRTPPR